MQNVVVSFLVGGKDLQMVVQEPRARFEQLQPFTNYSFYVVAYSERSPSERSAIITQRTDEDGKKLVHLESFPHIGNSSVMNVRRRGRRLPSAMFSCR
jgi:hypothetical protein